MKTQSYETPVLVDFGSLEELTLAGGGTVVDNCVDTFGTSPVGCRVEN